MTAHQTLSARVFVALPGSSVVAVDSIEAVIPDSSGCTVYLSSGIRVSTSGTVDEIMAAVTEGGPR